MSTNKRAPNYFAIVNPVSGGGRGRELAQQLESQLGAALIGCFETEPDSKLEPVVAQAANDGAAVVVAIGGDGTVAAVAKELIDKELRLAIVPGGTANVIAANLDIPADPEEAIALLGTDYNTATLDLMAVAEHASLLAVGAGIDGAVIEGAPRSEKDKLGRWAYLKQIFLQLFQPNSHDVELLLDGERIRARAVEVMAVNMPKVGFGPLTYGQDITPDDGVIDVGVVQAKSVGQLLLTFLGLTVGQPERLQNVTYYPLRRSLRVEASPPLKVQADGEQLGETPFEVKLHPKCIEVVIPG